VTDDRDPIDRNAILARRALLVSTALAALSCSSPDGPTTLTPTSSTAQVSGSAVASATATSQPGAPMPTWEEVSKNAPPRGIPKAAGALERQQLEWFERSLDEDYASVKAVWQGIPDCDAADPDCRGKWRELGQRAKAMYDATRGPMIGGCGGANGETASLNARKTAHHKFLTSLIVDAERHASDRAKSFSPQGEQEWLKLMANAKQPPPMPCLSPCPMPEVASIRNSVAFAKDKGTPSATDAELKQILDGIVAAHKANRKPSKIVVRGHADPREANPAELALARAKAIADLLVKGGVPKTSIDTAAFGAEYPIENGATPEGAASNQRVDFEAVPEKP
jgi:outer membrane protein OmpA-like peptidoglycan-associated protein